jgi:hypothetical protein
MGGLSRHHQARCERDRAADPGSGAVYYSEDRLWCFPDGEYEPVRRVDRLRSDKLARIKSARSAPALKARPVPRSTTTLSLSSSA